MRTPDRCFSLGDFKCQITRCGGQHIYAYRMSPSHHGVKANWCLAIHGSRKATLRRIRQSLKDRNY